MKSHYPGYYKPSKEFFAELWKNATVVFDTNVLLDLYRLSEETANKLLETIAFFSKNNRVFIPLQVAEEYHHNLLDIIFNQKAKYDGALKSLKEFESKISEKRNHPYLPSKLKERFTSLLTDIEASFKEQTRKIDDIITQPSIKDELASLLDGKIGKGYSKDELCKIMEEGARRYAEKIPPGFKDVDKSSDNQYGDFVIWKEILDYAKQTKANIIYVSSDVKEDWYLRLHGVTYGPHPSLIKEFQEFTSQNIYLYSLNVFLQEANKQKVAEIPKTSIEEVESVILTKRDNDMGQILAPAAFRTLSRLRDRTAFSLSSFSSQTSSIDGIRKEVDKSKSILGQVTAQTFKSSIPHIATPDLFGSIKITNSPDS